MTRSKLQIVASKQNLNSGPSDFKAHILISLSGKKAIKKAQEQEILPEKTRLNGASKQ